MTSPGFTFQQFTIQHDRCAMQVGTDGVLLGAWASLKNATQILDIGTGSGLIALMAAQRATQAQIIGIDIHTPSVQQAQANAAASPFGSRIQILEADIHTFHWPHKFTHILCNPPYHTENTLPPAEDKSRAKHTAELSLEQLLQSAARLIDANGTFSLILPAWSEETFIATAMAQGWHLQRRCIVHTVAHKPARRTLLALCRTPQPYTSAETLILQEKNGQRTPQYQALCQAFYLKKG